MPTLRGAARRLKKLISPTPAPQAEAGPPSEPPAAPPAPWHESPPSPWASFSVAEANADAFCPICRWTGAAFEGRPHSESALCPRCGAIARDRFLFWCYTQRTAEQLGARVLETSPRLGEDYRAAMATWFTYLCSDYDESAHKGVERLDLQAIDKPDGSFDAILTPHVLEHVPDTDKALDEIMRVLAPGGRMYLQVPVLQGVTAPPESPEFHGDNTPVFWRFGFDLTARLREHGFTTTLLCTEEWRNHVAAGAASWPEDTSPEFDVDSMSAGAILDDLTVVADRRWADRIGVQPAYQFVTWECVKDT